MTTGAKRCLHCELTLPLSAFGIHSQAGRKKTRRNVCKECLRAQAKRYYAEHRDEYLARSRRRAAMGGNARERAREAERAYRERNRERVNFLARQRRAANPEHFREIKRGDYRRAKARKLAEVMQGVSR